MERSENSNAITPNANAVAERAHTAALSQKQQYQAAEESEKEASVKQFEIDLQAVMQTEHHGKHVVGLPPFRAMCLCGLSMRSSLLSVLMADSGKDKEEYHPRCGFM